MARRRLILRDTMSILSLTLVTSVLFAITLFLFRSFSTHRQDLAQRWAERGRLALQANRPAEAIADLRTALSYAPDTRAYELLLAEALGQAGDTDASYNYFMGLWETEPGNGLINLQLARLSAKRNRVSDAEKFYRASIFGTWEEGDGVLRRADVRLELARYLIRQHDLVAARMELLVAGGNAPDDYERDMSLGQFLEQAADPVDAWTYYQKAMAGRPGDPAALEAAGRLAYQTGDYEAAHRMLERAIAEHGGKNAVGSLGPDDEALSNNAARILQLLPQPSQTPTGRTARILAALSIARKRFEACSAQIPQPVDLPASLQTLSTRWAGVDGKAKAAILLRDPTREQAAMQLVYDTEVRTDRFCGHASGDDALLLRLATTPLNTSTEAGRSSSTNVPHD